MDPSRPLLGRSAVLSSSARAAAAAALLVVALFVLTARRLPASLSSSIASPPASRREPEREQEQEQEHLGCDPSSPLDCADRRLFHLMMRSAIDAFPTVHFSRFGRPVPGDPATSSCDMAWHARSSASDAAKYKDYRRFAIARDPVSCAYSVTSIGEYHSGHHARKPRPRLGGANANANATVPPPPPAISRSQFAAGKYLAYLGGGDRCKPMPHYLRSLLCAIAEAQYLNRTLVLDLSLCLAATYTTGMAEEGKRLAFYIDIEHLQSEVGIVEQRQFWADWDRWGVQGQIGLHLVEDTIVTPFMLSKARETLIVRKFGDVEPGNYWYHVCEGEGHLQQPWKAIRWASSLMRIADAIISRLQTDFDSVHFGGDGEGLRRMIEGFNGQGRQVYVAGDITMDVALVEKLKAEYKNVHNLGEFEELWGTDSMWFLETKRLNDRVPVDFDGYMRELVDREVFLKGKKKVEVLR